MSEGKKWMSIYAQMHVVKDIPVHVVKDIPGNMGRKDSTRTKREMNEHFASFLQKCGIGAGEVLITNYHDGEHYVDLAACIYTDKSNAEINRAASVIRIEFAK